MSVFFTGKTFYQLFDKRFTKIGSVSAKRIPGGRKRRETSREIMRCNRSLMPCVDAIVRIRVQDLKSFVQGIYSVAIITRMPI
jgi:hypothetical protein